MVLYGSSVISYATVAYDGPVKDGGNFAVVAIIFVMALIEVFLAIMGTFASNERNSAYMQVQYVDLYVCVCFTVFPCCMSSLFVFVNFFILFYCTLFLFSDGVTYR